MTPEVLQEMAQEDGQVQGLHILALESEVKHQVSLLGRDGKGGDSQNPLSPAEMMQDRSLSPWRPCSANIGDEQKPTLIEKG